MKSNPNILFSIDIFLFHFCLAYYLQNRLDANFYALIDTNSEPKKFFENQDLVKFQKSWFLHDNIEKTSKEIAKELGIDHAYILGSLKQLADTSEDQNIALQSLKELGKAIGTLGNQVKKIETGVVGMFQGFSPEEIEGASRAILPETTSEEESK